MRIEYDTLVLTLSRQEVALLRDLLLTATRHLGKQERILSGEVDKHIQKLLEFGQTLNEKCTR